jgi:F0F1-type ATP synthase assembly protein I
MTDEKRNGQDSWSAASLAWELGYIIAVPLVVLALLGRFIDKKYGTSPWFLLVGIVLSILVSSYAAYNKSKEIIDKQ